MIIDISKIILTKNKESTFNCSVDNKEFNYNHSSYSIVNCNPFEISVVNEGAKHLIISCKTLCDIMIPCDRCLDDVSYSFDISVNKTFKLSDGALVADDEEIPYIEEGKLDTDKLIFDAILVDWPAKVLCKEDCKGICPMCGTNLNVKACDCKPQIKDPRMAKFQDLFDEFKEV